MSWRRPLSKGAYAIEHFPVGLVFRSHVLHSSEATGAVPAAATPADPGSRGLSGSQTPFGPPGRPVRWHRGPRVPGRQLVLEMRGPMLWIDVGAQPTESSTWPVITVAAHLGDSWRHPALPSPIRRQPSALSLRAVIGKVYGVRVTSVGARVTFIGVRVMSISPTRTLGVSRG